MLCSADRAKQATDTRVDTPSSLYRAWRISGATTQNQMEHNKQHRKIKGRDGRESVAITRRHSAIEQSHVSRPKTLSFSKHIGPHCKASGHRASAATTTTSTARCQTARRFPSHPRSSTNQPIIAVTNTIIVTTKPTEHRSPPSISTAPSTEFSSSAATTEAVPTKLRN